MDEYRKQELYLELCDVCLKYGVDMVVGGFRETATDTAFFFLGCPDEQDRKEAA